MCNQPQLNNRCDFIEESNQIVKWAGATVPIQVPVRSSNKSNSDSNKGNCFCPFLLWLTIGFLTAWVRVSKPQEVPRVECGACPHFSEMMHHFSRGNPQVVDEFPIEMPIYFGDFPASHVWLPEVPLNKNGVWNQKRPKLWDRIRVGWGQGCLSFHAEPPYLVHRPQSGGEFPQRQSIDVTFTKALYLYVWK